MPRRRSNKKPSHTFITSNKGKNLLVIHNYIYQQSKITPNVTYWICKIKDCNARAHTKTNTGELIKQTGNDHCHLPSPEEVEVRSFKNIVKERVKQETLPIGQIYEEELGRAKLSTTALVQVSTANKARKYTDLFLYIYVVCS
jgi:FLYWCH-type zinc finger protein